MGQELRPLRPGAYHLRGGSNQGLIVQGDRALLVDAGLDKNAAKEILKAAQTLGVRIVAVLITHGHTDHFGGAATLRQRLGVPIYAPAVEKGVIEAPVLEPMYLFSGASPLDELTHRFILAKEPCPVDHELQAGPLLLDGFTLAVVPLPGHAPNQMGIVWEDVFFVSDGFFPVETLDKYGVPFYVDVDATLATLDRLAAMQFAWWAPGHGDAVQDPAPLLDANRRRVLDVRDRCHEALDAPRSVEDVLAAVLDGYDRAVDSVAVYYLCRTTVHACLASLRAAGQVTLELTGNRALWRRA